MKADNTNTVLVVCAFALVLIATTNLSITLLNRHSLKEGLQLQRAFQTRTVDRWDKLQRDNPNLRVPLIVEPIAVPHLDDSQMQRPTPSPEPSPTPAL